MTTAPETGIGWDISGGMVEGPCVIDGQEFEHDVAHYWMTFSLPMTTPDGEEMIVDAEVSIPPHRDYHPFTLVEDV